jgi:hypothetical protein
MAKVIELVPEEVGDSYAFNADQILENNKGKFESLVLIGEDEDGDLVIYSTHNVGVANIMLDMAKQQLVARD